MNGKQLVSTKSKTTMVRVLVFPSCNEPGLEIVRSLVDQSGIEVHGASCYTEAEDASASLLKRHAQFPLLGEPEFKPAFLKYLHDEKIDIIFPSMEKVVREFSTWKVEGVRFITQRPEIAAMVESKQKTYDALSGVVPLPGIFESSVPEYPVYGKPPAGSGGRGQIVIHNDSDLRWARDQDLLVTEYLPGGEIVAYSLGDLEGNHVVSITKTMGRWCGGASQLGLIKDDAVVRGHALAIAKKLRLVGPWFAQFRQDRHGVYKLMEVNARPGGAIGICRYAGVNVPLLAVKLFAGQPVTIPRHAEAVSWVRNLKPFLTTTPFDRVVWSRESFTRAADGKLRPQAIQALFDLANRDMAQDCYGADVQAALANWNLGNHFQQQHNSFAEALIAIDRPAQTIVITNDLAEQLELNEKMPAVRIVSTGTLETLGQEKM